MPDTIYISAVHKVLAEKYPQPNPLWNLSSDNQLGVGWLWATPVNVWGKLYSQWPQAVPGSGPLGLAPCTGSESGGPTQLCHPMDASMTAPDQAPARLLIGHTDLFVDALYDLMISAEVLLDVTSLSPPTGRFLDAMKNAMRYLSGKPDGKRPVVRILVSNPWPNVPLVTSDPLIRDLTRQLDPDKRMEVYVYIMSSSFASWNHAKIVAADGVRAIVGGHNQWGPDYLGQNPTFDLSMRITGTAARHAQDFANNLWVYGQWRKDRLSQWVYNASESIMSLQSGYLPATGTGPSQVQAGTLPAPSRYAELTARFPAPPPGGTVPVLAVGRGGNAKTTYLLPTNKTYSLPFSEPSDEALVELVNQAKHTVRMSIQSLWVVYGIIAGWNIPLLKAIAEALRRGVNVDMVLANPDWPWQPYSGDSPATVNAKLASTMVQLLKVPQEEAAQTLSEHLRVASIRFSAEGTYPKDVQIGNHAKSFIVDDSVFIIGSQNMYSCNLNEFGYIVEDATAAQAYIDTYWTPLWNWSKSTVTTSIDADVKTDEQVEAMQFIMALQLDTLMDNQWSDLLDQHKKATDPDARSAIEESMTELIVSNGFNSTAVTVLAGLQQPFFTETPPSTEATPEALRFVISLMNDTQLMTDFNQAVAAAAGNVDAYNAAITKFLKDRKYDCTALEVLAAFSALRNKTLAYWTGTHTVWLTNDGGLSYANATTPAAQPRAARALAAEDPLPVPELGPPLVVNADGVTFDGVVIAKATYNNNLLTWSSTDGNPTSASIQFGTVTRGTVNDSFTGAECFGTITYPSTGDGHHGVYSLYGRVSAPAEQDPKSYTVGYVISALVVVGLLAALGLFLYVSKSRQAELGRIGQQKRDSDYEDARELDRVGSSKLLQEGSVYKGALTQRRNRTVMETQEELVKYSRNMTREQLTRLEKSATETRETDEVLQDPPAETISTVVTTANSRIDGVISALKNIVSSVTSKLSTESRTSIDGNTRLADQIGEDIDKVTEEEEEGDLFGLEDY
jgi:phosphatidylserine/phosphatidylglycerophosphate/cardiolipin synthase-like enzyme